MSAWREWEDPVHGGNINLVIMPSLCNLSIRDCKKLKSLPHLFDSVPFQTLDVAANEEGDMVRIRNSSRMDEATSCKTIIASAATLPQPELREISRHGNSNGSATINFMPSLRILSLWMCPKLKALPSFLRIVRLEDLSIGYCPGLATWWINEAGEDWYNWKSNIPRFNFPDGPSTADLETEDESP